MRGACVPLPVGFSGAVLNRAEDVCSSQDEEPEARTEWHVTATFREFHYWNHDSIPVSNDGVRRCMEWASLAEAIHSPIDPQEVEKALEESI